MLQIHCTDEFYQITLNALKYHQINVISQKVNELISEFTIKNNNITIKFFSLTVRDNKWNNASFHETALVRTSHESVATQ